MASLKVSLQHNLRSLTHFYGRDSRALFWPWAILLFLMSNVACVLAMLPEILRMLLAMRQFAAEHPELTTVSQGPAHYSVQIEGFHPELMPDFKSLIISIALVAFGVVLLVAAAVSRRLHDRDRSGLWGLLPLPFLVTGFALMLRLFEDFSNRIEPDPVSFMMLFFNNIIYIVALVYLIFVLAGEGTSGPNRYGPQPLE